MYFEEFEKYANNLAKRARPVHDLEALNKIYNKIVEQQHLRGCGIAQIEAEVHEIRTLIRDYFASGMSR